MTTPIIGHPSISNMTTPIIGHPSISNMTTPIIGHPKRIPCCHSSGQSCPGESGSIPRRAFRRAWEWDLTSRDNSVPKKWQRGILFLTRNYQTIAKKLNKNEFWSVLHSFYSNLSSVMIVGARAQRTIDQSQTWFQNPRWRSLNTTGMDLSHVGCDPTYFHYPTTKSKK